MTKSFANLLYKSIFLQGVDHETSPGGREANLARNLSLGRFPELAYHIEYDTLICVPKLD
ncbi:hypothetical protein JHL21_16345 [Devosia sp. WQ 349]|uniref:hypothetical protein n=1 Tax=Devosia sp. WQ 349K1 TaxID=2800329 RepID=UPI0019079D2B|nr:hypothetical protein [Devosia sp. WQ 349K1]MBK1796064.1 hypothetical protein [Devosia sp. WQ 349K1]